MNPLPTFDQIKHVKHLQSTRLFSPAAISRLSGVPLRDVFRITRSMFSAIIVSPDGTILDGTHRLVAAK